MAPVSTPSGNYVAHAASRIGGIACIARDDMDVDVHNRLSGDFPDIHPDVVAVRVIVAVENLPALIQEIEDRHPLPA